MMIPVPEKQAVWGFFPCFWESKVNLSTKNVLLTWGNWQVLHMWELFDCTAYNCINSELLPGSWFLNVPDCDLHFLIHQNNCHLRALRSFIQEPSWVGFTCYHILHWKGSKQSGAFARHLLSCVQLECILLTPCKALMMRPTIKEPLKHWYVTAFMLN